MANKVGRRTNILAVGAAVFVTLVLVTSFSNANLVIDDMVITLESTDWYNGATNQFQLEYAGAPGFPASVLYGIARTANSEDYEYMFVGTLAITPANLLENQSGSLAKGKFAGGVTMTIVGDLFNMFSGEYIITGDTILVAQMSSNPWYLEEMLSPPAPLNKIRGSAFFNTIGGKLFNGDNSIGLTLPGFRADFTFPGVTPDVTNFGSTSYSSSEPTIQTVIPEPASISLFCLAALAFMRNRKS